LASPCKFCLKRRPQPWDADQIVSDQVEQEVGADSLKATVFHFAHCAVLFAPAENTFGHFAAGLRKGITDVARRAPVNRALAAFLAPPALRAIPRGFNDFGAATASVEAGLGLGARAALKNAAVAFAGDSDPAPQAGKARAEIEWAATAGAKQKDLSGSSQPRQRGTIA
jgi:hypothetical protein